MRIAIHADGPRIRGNERQVVLLAGRLVRRGHEVLASCRDEGPVREALERVGVRTTGTRPRGDIDLFSALRFAHWLRRERVEALLVTSWKRAAVAGWAARRARVPRVVLRLGGLRGEERGLGPAVRRFALARWYDAVIVNSAMVREDVLRLAPGLDPGMVSVVPNAVELEAAPAAPLRQTLDLEADDCLVLVVGGLERNKGVDLIPEMLARLGSHVHVAVAGAGSGEAQAALRMGAREAGAEDRLHLLGHRPDVAALLAAADAFTLPSRADSMPNALLEAMAAGCPAVMPAVGGVEGALGAADGRPPAGWVVPREDPGELADALSHVLGDLQAGGVEARARTREARWRVENWYGPDAMTDAYEGILTGEGAR